MKKILYLLPLMFISMSVMSMKSGPTAILVSATGEQFPLNEKEAYLSSSIRFDITDRHKERPIVIQKFRSTTYSADVIRILAETLAKIAELKPNASGNYNKEELQRAIDIKRNLEGKDIKFIQSYITLIEFLDIHVFYDILAEYIVGHNITEQLKLGRGTNLAIARFRNL